MLPRNGPPNAPFKAKYFPLHLALLTVGENMLPIGNWTVISKDPFRVLIAMSVGNHSLSQEDIATLGERWTYEKSSFD